MRESGGNFVLKRAREFLCRYSTLVRGRRVGVAVSGGSDSMALLGLFAELAGEFEMRLAVLHFHHALRGEEADADERFVTETAAERGLAFYNGRWHEAPTANLEAAARKARLQFFREQSQALGLAAVATGHTRDDQAETVMLRLLRGTGTAGLAGVLPVTREGLIRPLLGCTRAELREWLTGRGQTWREDRSNLDTAFASRNRMRAELLPNLRREWNPGLDVALAHLATVAQAEEEYWEAETARLLPESLIFDRTEMLSHPLAVRRRLLRAAIRRAKGDLQRIEFQHVDRALALFERPSGDGRVTLSGGVTVERSFGQIRVAHGAPPALPAVRWRVRRADQPEIDAYNRDRFYLDAEKVTLPLTLRSWQKGDLFRPIGSERPKKLKELFQERRVPSWERPGWPMLVSAGTIVWTRGYGAAAGWAAPPGARQVVEVEDSENFARKVESNAAQPASITVA